MAIDDLILIGAVLLLAWLIWGSFRKPSVRKHFPGSDKAGRDHTKPERNDDGQSEGSGD